MMKQFIIYITLVFTFTSCEKYSDVEMKDLYQDKLVTAGFLEEGAMEVEIGVTRTVPVFNHDKGMDNYYVNDADVRIKTPGNEYSLTYDVISNTYRGFLSEQIEEGVEYEVLVSHNGENVTGKTKIPLPVAGTVNVVIDSVEDFGEYIYTADVRATVTGSGTHNASLMVIMVYEDSSSYPMIAENYILEAIGKVKAGDGLSGKYRSSFTSGWVRPLRIDIKMLVCDNAYARYNNMVKGASWDITGGPSSEPLIGYGNMSNGVGAFGAYRYVHLKSVSLQ